MKKTVIAGFLAIVLLGWAGTAWGTGFSLTAKAGYFWPSDEIFREVYKGGPIFGGEFALTIVKGLDAWVGADFFSKTGELTFTEEDTKIRILPVYAGLRYRFTPSKASPYLAAAAGYFLFKEENIIGTVSEDAVGFIVQAGVVAKLSGILGLDVHARYSNCKTTVGEVEAQIGGFTAGMGFIIDF